jgi:hypothetical protein
MQHPLNANKCQTFCILSALEKLQSHAFTPDTS